MTDRALISDKSSANRAVLIDGHSLLFRAYHALPKTFTDKNGSPTNAVYGFFSMLIRVVEDLRPTHLAVAFDEKGPTFRHQELVTYKEGRPEMEEELSVQGPIVRDLLEAFSISVYSVAGYEGEDVLATIVAKIENLIGHPELVSGSSRPGRKIPKSKILNQVQDPVRDDGGQNSGLEIFIVSGDRDVLQLIDESVSVYSPKKGLSEPVIYTPENVEAVFGVKASLIPDYKGLRGDPSDRIPGVFGIGEKTAAQLINKYGSIENLYQKIVEVRKEFGESVFQKLTVGAEQAVLSQKIARINREVPLAVDLERLKFNGLRRAEGLDRLRHLGFKSLLKRLGFAAKESIVRRKKEKTSVGNQGTLL